MAVLDSIESLDPLRRPDWQSALSRGQFGALAEDLLAVSLQAAGRGSGTIARPIVDRGVDLYLRRLRSLLTIPVQVKALMHLDADGNAKLELPVADVSDDPNGRVAIVHLPPPCDQLHGRVFLVPFTTLRERCRRSKTHGVERFSITADFTGDSRDLLGDCLVDLARLPEWLDALPGWSTPVAPVPDGPRPHVMAGGSAPMQWRGDIGRLWVATELEHAGGGLIVIAEDRVRLDTVSLLIHDLSSPRIAGLHIRSTRVTPDRQIHFNVLRPSFFIDQMLYVLVVLLKPDDRPHDFCLLIPSTAIPGLGYAETVTLDPLTKRFESYRVPSDEVAQVFLKCVFGV